MDLSTTMTATKAKDYLYNNLNLNDRLGIEFREMLQSERFKELSYDKKRLEVSYHMYTICYIIMFGRNDFNKELKLLTKRYL